MTPLVSAVVLNYRTAKDAVKCVAALQRQTIADQLEILVVDNHSEDESIGFLRNRLQREKNVHIIESRKNGGYGQGNELGIRHARGEFILIINPDNELEPDALQTMVTCLQADPSIGILAPLLIQDDGTIRRSFRRFPTIWDVFIKRTFLRRFFPERMERYLQETADPEIARDVDWVAGACLLLRRDLYRELGGFDPRFFLFFEDTDLCRRCWAAGKRVVYEPRARAHDLRHRLSEGGFLSIFTKKTVRIHLLSAIKYFWKWKNVSNPFVR